MTRKMPLLRNFFKDGFCEEGVGSDEEKVPPGERANSPPELQVVGGAEQTRSGRDELNLH